MIKKLYYIQVLNKRIADLEDKIVALRTRLSEVPGMTYDNVRVQSSPKNSFEAGMLNLKSYQAEYASLIRRKADAASEFYSTRTRYPSTDFRVLEVCLFANPPFNPKAASQYLEVDLSYIYKILKKYL